MRIVFTLLFSSLFSTFGFSQAETTKTSLPLNSLLQGRMGCGIVPDDPVRKDSTKTKIIIRCGLSRSVDTDGPLYVIDGVLFERFKLSKIKPSDISSIWVLNVPDALALCGSRGENGIVIITTKRDNSNSVVVKDFLTGNPVIGATVSLFSIDKKDTLMFATDDAGKGKVDKLNQQKEYIISISAVGFKTIRQPFNNTGKKSVQQFLMIRDERVCEPVFIKSHSCLRSSNCYISFSCGVKGVVIEVDSTTSHKLNPSENSFNVYPNPTQKGSYLKLQINSNKKGKHRIKILSMNGSQLYSNEIDATTDKRNFQIPIDALWPAGVYILQLIYENGRIAASEKIIIQ